MRFILNVRPLTYIEKSNEKYFMSDQDDFDTGLQSLFLALKEIDCIINVMHYENNSFVIETRSEYNTDELKQKIKHIFSDLFDRLRLESLNPAIDVIRTK